MGKGDSAVSPAPAAAKLLPLLGTKEQAEETVTRTQAERVTQRPGVRQRGLVNPQERTKDNKYSHHTQLPPAGHIRDTGTCISTGQRVSVLGWHAGCWREESELPGSKEKKPGPILKGSSAN